MAMGKTLLPGRDSDTGRRITDNFSFQNAVVLASSFLLEGRDAPPTPCHPEDGNAKAATILR